MGDKRPSRNDKGRNTNSNPHNQDNNQEHRNVARSLASEFEEAAQEDLLIRTATALYIITRIASLLWLSQQIALGKLDPLFLAAALRTYDQNTNTRPSSTEIRLADTTRSHNTTQQISSPSTTETSFEEDDDTENSGKNTTYVSAADIMHSLQLSRKSALLSSSFRTFGSISTDNADEEDDNAPTTSGREELEMPQALVVTHLADGGLLINGQLFAEQDTHTPQVTPRRPSTPETPPAPVKKSRNETDSDSEDYLDQEETDIDTLSPIAPEEFFSTQRTFESPITPLAEPERTLFGDDSKTQSSETNESLVGRDLFGGHNDTDDDLPGSCHDQ